MKKTLLILIVSLLLTAYSSSEGAALRNGNVKDYTITVFYHQEDTEGWKSVLKGKIISIGTKDEYDKNDISASSRDRTKTTIRLYNAEGIKKEDMLFIINSKNMIVAKVQVIKVFESVSFGPLVVGYGNLRLAKQGDRVVMKIEDAYSKYAYIYRARGDYYRETGDTAESINNYKKSIEMDKGNPEAHFELGKIYLNEGLYQFAFREFNIAYKNIGRLYDREDKFQLLKYMTETRFKQAYNTDIKEDLKNKYITEGISYSREALSLNPDSEDIHYYLGVFYYKNSNPSDVDSKNHLMKAIEKDPENINAFILLAELYYRHKNMLKSRQYAESALKIDPSNERAKFIRSLTEKQE